MSNEMCEIYQQNNCRYVTNDNTVCRSIIALRDCTETFLACSIPNLNLKMIFFFSFCFTFCFYIRAIGDVSLWLFCHRHWLFSLKNQHQLCSHVVRCNCLFWIDAQHTFFPFHSLRSKQLWIKNQKCLRLVLPIVLLDFSSSFWSEFYVNERAIAVDMHFIGKLNTWIDTNMVYCWT